MIRKLTIIILNIVMVVLISLMGNFIFSIYVNLRAEREFGNKFCWIEPDPNSSVGYSMRLSKNSYFTTNIAGNFWMRYVGIGSSDPYVLPLHFAILKLDDSDYTTLPSKSELKVGKYSIYGWSYFNFEFWKIDLRNPFARVPSQPTKLAQECRIYLSQGSSNAR